MEILLTGATGFLGRHIVPLLLASGHVVHSLCRKPCAQVAPNLIEISGDLTSSRVEEEISWGKLDAVIHLAAAGVKASNRTWPDALEVNVGGTLKLITAIGQRATKKPKVVVARTFYEDLITQEPSLRNNPYIATKSMATNLVRSWANSYPGQTMFATIFQIFGPGDDAGSVLSYAARRMTRGQTAQFGSGTGLRDWIYVEDAAAAVVALLACNHAGVSHWDIGSGQLTALRAMVEAMADCGQVDRALLDFDPTRDRKDTELVMAARYPPPLWQPRIALCEGLRRMWAAARKEFDQCE